MMGQKNIKCGCSQHEKQLLRKYDKFWTTKVVQNEYQK